MEQITKKEAVEALVKMFSAVPFEKRVNGCNFYNVGDNRTKFYIDKRNVERDGVMETLMSYFKDNELTDGRCLVDSVTFLWTSFTIE